VTRRRDPGDDEALPRQAPSPALRGDAPGAQAREADAAEAVTADLSEVDAVEDPSGDPAARGPSVGRNPDGTTEVLQVPRQGGSRRADDVRIAASPPAAPLADPVVRRLGGLRLKFNVVLAFAFGVGFALAGGLARAVLADNARAEVIQSARIMMESALGARAYTATHVKPLLQDQMRERFLPETVSAYAAAQIFLSLRSSFPEYTYKEAALNPRNPADRASDWESDLVQQFRNHPQQGELVVVRSTPTGEMLHMARPLRVDDRGCLTCHGRLEDAPKPMTDIYGTTSGFGWQMNEVVAAQIVSVPMSVPLARARETLTTFMMLLGGVFVLLLLLLNVLLHFIVIQPVVRMARIATDVSLGKEAVPEYVLHGRDEIASLSQSFHRMRLSLENAMKMLDE
jgi:protein-histidine pros-kinase